MLRRLKVRVAGDAVEISVAVRNDGSVEADEIVQAYISFPGIVADRPVKSLKAFQRVPLGPGQTQIVDMYIPVSELAWRNPKTHRWDIESGTHHVLVGGSSTDLLSVPFEI